MTSRCPLQILPRYFKHNKLGSFYQQLHTYGFRRVGSHTDASLEFAHDQYLVRAHALPPPLPPIAADCRRLLPLAAACRRLPPPIDFDPGCSAAIGSSP